MVYFFIVSSKYLFKASFQSGRGLKSLSISFDLSNLELNGHLAIDTPYSSVVTLLTFTSLLACLSISIAKSTHFIFGEYRTQRCDASHLLFSIFYYRNFSLAILGFVSYILLTKKSLYLINTIQWFS